MTVIGATFLCLVRLIDLSRTMAEAEQVKEKKKNRLRSCFLLGQASSLDDKSASTSTAGNHPSYIDIYFFNVLSYGLRQMIIIALKFHTSKVNNNILTENDESVGSSESTSRCSRIRKILFHRSRSDERVRNIRIKETAESSSILQSSVNSSLDHPSQVLVQDSPPPSYQVRSYDEVLIHFLMQNRMNA